jgi:ABC-type transport system involved in cytochrome bd biosynthesis fused ATPase/permease subunit
MISELIAAQKLKFFSVLAFSILNSLLEVVGLGSFILLLERAMSGGSSAVLSFGVVEMSIPVAYLPWICISFFFLKAIFHLIYFYSLGRLVYGTEVYFNQLLFNYYVSDHQATDGDSSELIRRNMLTEVPMFAQNYMQSIFHIISESLLLLAIGGVCFFIFQDFWFELTNAAIFLVLIIALSMLLTQPLRKWGRDRQLYSAANIREVSALASGWKDIRANSLQNTSFERYSASIVNYSKYMASMFPVQASPRVIFETIIIACFVFGFFYVESEKYAERAELPVISILALVALRVYPSLAKIGSLITLANFAKSSHETLNELYVARKTTTVSNLKRQLLQTRGRETQAVMTLHNFSMRIPNQEKPINIDKLEINHGDIVIVSGPNGSGKTTLLDVLSGVSDLGTGHLYYYSETSRLPQIKYCTQFPFFTDNSVVSQAKFYRETPERVHEILSASGFFDKTTLTKVMSVENAQVLSGGEKTKIACAELLARETDLLLLDEPTASMDKESTSALVKVISNKAAGGTAFIIVSHDNSFDDLATKQLRTG